MSNLKGFDALHAAYIQQDLQKYIDETPEYKKAYLEEHEVLVGSWYYGKYEEKTNSVRLNLQNPFTGKKPMYVKLATKYDIPSHYKKLRVIVKTNRYYCEKDDPDDIILCDLDPDIKNEIEEIKRIAQKKIAEEKRKSELEIRHKTAKEKTAVVQSKEHFNQIIQAIVNAEAFLAAEKAAGTLPEFRDYLFDYNNIKQQAAYNMRYLYAYSYEYLTMLLKMVNMGLPQSKIRMLSLGCGTKADLWALEEAFIRKKLFPEIEYIGVDKALWEKNLCIDSQKNISIEARYGEKAGEYLAKTNDLRFDIIMFPKSFGDIIKNDGEDFKKIMLSFTHMPLKDTFYVAFSFVQNETEDIIIKARRLADNVINRGYSGTFEFVEAEDNKGEIGYSREVPFELLPGRYAESSKALAGRHYIKYRNYENNLICKFVKE